jgi:RimJ/RimL family protein N-acetyltransferase
MNVWQGARVRLRAVEPSDADIHYLWNRDSDMSRGVDYLWPPSSRESQRRWAEAASTRKDPNEGLELVIETLDGEHAGTINAHHCDRRTGCFSYGVAIRPEHQRRGYATEAILLLLRYYFEELRYQKCTVDVYDFNDASIRLHERLGFQLEGRLRRIVFTRGRHHDALMYGLTVEEFQAAYPRPDPAAATSLRDGQRLIRNP